MTFLQHRCIALLLICLPLFTSAQKNNLYADIGVPGGLSVTADHQLTRDLSVGVGIQGYRFRPTITNKDAFTPAVFGDVRLNSRMRAKHFFFYFLDLGMNFYKANNDPAQYNALFDFVPKNDGFYTGLGIGYFRRMTKTGGGAYISLKMVGNIYKDDEFSYKTNEQHVAAIYDGTAALSLGFRFNIAKSLHHITAKKPN